MTSKRHCYEKVRSGDITDIAANMLLAGPAKSIRRASCMVCGVLGDANRRKPIIEYDGAVLNITTCNACGLALAKPLEINDAVHTLSMLAGGPLCDKSIFAIRFNKKVVKKRKSCADV